MDNVPFLNLVHLDLLLPIGISFYTFQSLSYLIDLRSGKVEIEKNFANFALYVSFFPQLVAGPIERAGSLMPQLSNLKGFDKDKVVAGLKLIIIGFFLKLVIADRLALAVDSVYMNVENFSSLTHLLSSYFFAFQIYGDFAGYSLIAIGLAKIMGVDLSPNFRRPYFASSVRDFWRRWHITLSNWFRDYVYIPLGGSRKGKPRIMLNVLIVFALSGLWHGAAWTFVVWGLLHAVFIIFGVLFAPLLKKIPRFLGILCTFHLVVLSWIFFRANSIKEAWYVVKSIFGGEFVFSLASLDFGIGMPEVFLAILLIIGLVIFQYFQEFRSETFHKLMRNSFLSFCAYGLLFLMILSVGVLENKSFIYFQF